MKILFVLQHSGYARNFESTIIELACREHEVIIGLNSYKKHNEGAVLLQEMIATNRKIQLLGQQLPERKDIWSRVLRGVRGARDYLRYLTPQYHSAFSLRQRIEKRFPRVVTLFFRGVCGLMPVTGPQILSSILIAIEDAIPASSSINKFLFTLKPDLMLVTPLTDFASIQTEYLKSARSMGLRCALCVHSWDNLTNKGLVRILPDKIFVWNEKQKGEAVKWHGATPSNVIVTGAQCFDKWFDRAPSVSKEAFLAKTGLNVEGDDLILYLCSSPFIAPKEVKFVRKWLKAIRANEALKKTRVLIRPHPQNSSQWEGVDLEDDLVAIWPRAGANPVTTESKNDFYDSMFHSNIVVGINSSSMIEAGILGKVVLTVLDNDFKGSQEGTLHFHHLVNGGLLKISNTVDEHALQLAASLSDQRSDHGRVATFTENFVRPHGLRLACTPILVEAIEALGNIKPLPVIVAPWWGALIRILVLPFALALNLKHQGILMLRKAFPRMAYLTLSRVLTLLRLKSILQRIFVAGRIIMFGEYGLNSGKVRCNNELRRIARSEQLIIVGPWLSEVGFEVLYWVPFLRWALEEFNISPSRVIVISRGGAKLWYEGLFSQYIDVFELLTTEQYKTYNEERIRITGGQKHNLISPLDEKVLEWAKAKIGANSVDWIHPKLMYDLFTDFWRRFAPVSLIENHTRYKQYLSPPIRNDVVLPSNFVAVKFYFSAAFPDTKENRNFLSMLIHRLAKKTHVVLLSSGLKIDDHDELEEIKSERIHSVSSLMQPEDNLALQTYVISRASAFYGTYGGFSYLPPLYGVPSYSFYTAEGKFLPVHLDVAHRAYRSIKYGSFDKLDKSKNMVGKEYVGNPCFIAMSASGFEVLENML